jgi:hypothetical protein
VKPLVELGRKRTVPFAAGPTEIGSSFKGYRISDQRLTKGAYHMPSGSTAPLLSAKRRAVAGEMVSGSAST